MLVKKGMDFFQTKYKLIVEEQNITYVNNMVRWLWKITLKIIRYVTLSRDLALFPRSGVNPNEIYVWTTNVWSSPALVQKNFI